MSVDAPTSQADVHVMTAGMHDRDSFARAVQSRCLAGIFQAGCFLNRQRVHIGAQHHGRAGPVSQHPYYSGLSDS